MTIGSILKTPQLTQRIESLGQPFSTSLFSKVNPLSSMRGQLPSKRLTPCAARNASGMRTPPFNLNPNNYPILQGIKPANLHDEICLDSWPGRIIPNKSTCHSADKHNTFGKHETAIDLEVAEQLIAEITAATEWLAQEPFDWNEEMPPLVLGSQAHDELQKDIIIACEHFANEYWMPKIFDTLTPTDWLSLIDQAQQDEQTAHFLGLLITQFCYCNNYGENHRLQLLEEKLATVGISLEPVNYAGDYKLATIDRAKPLVDQSLKDNQDQIDQHLVDRHMLTQSVEHLKQPTKTSVKTPPTIGYLLRKDKFWCLGLAGTQTVTLGSNLAAHAKALILGGKHWGYHDYYQKVIHPSLTKLIQNIETQEGKVDFCQLNFHIAGHSMGGALAEIAAHDFKSHIHSSKDTHQAEQLSVFGPPAKTKPKSQAQLKAKKTQPKDAMDIHFLATPCRNDETQVTVHMNNSSRAGGYEFDQELKRLNIHKFTSKHIQDIVSHVPPDFLGYGSMNNGQKTYNNSFHETSHKLKILNKNWSEGFIRHRLGVFLVSFTPAPVRKILAQKNIKMPKGQTFKTLGYAYK